MMVNNMIMNEKSYFGYGSRTKLISEIQSREFKNICSEASQEAENDFYTLKDILINDYKFEIVEACGGFEVSKAKGVF